MANPLIWLLVIIVVFAWMFGGSKGAKAALKIIGKLVADLVGGILHFAADLLAGGLRAAGRPLERGARRMLHLPPPAPPRRRRRPRREEPEDDEDDDH